MLWKIRIRRALQPDTDLWVIHELGHCGPVGPSQWSQYEIFVRSKRKKRLSIRTNLERVQLPIAHDDKASGETRVVFYRWASVFRARSGKLPVVPDLRTELEVRELRCRYLDDVAKEIPLGGLLSEEVYLFLGIGGENCSF